MKIVIATPFYPPEKGISALYSSGLESALTARGHTVVVVPFCVHAALLSGLRHLRFALALAKAARGAQHVLALDTWSVGLPSFIISKLFRVPLSFRIGGDFLWETYAERTKKPIRFSDVYREQDSFSAKENIIMRLTGAMLRHAHTLFFNTRFQISAWEKIYHFDTTKAVLLENVFPRRTSELAPPRGRVFVAAGRPIALKNYALVERAIARVQEKYPDVSLDRRSLPPDEHRERVRESYAVIIPSYSEISSNTAIDAVIAGKPFIMTDDTGTKERLGDYGLFIDTRSENDLVHAIEELLDEKRYAEITERIARFSFTRVWDDLVDEICANL